MEISGDKVLELAQSVTSLVNAVQQLDAINKQQNQKIAALEAKSKKKE